MGESNGADQPVKKKRKRKSKALRKREKKARAALLAEQEAVHEEEICCSEQWVDFQVQVSEIRVLGDHDRKDEHCFADDSTSKGCTTSSGSHSGDDASSDFVCPVDSTTTKGINVIDLLDCSCSRRCIAACLEIADVRICSGACKSLKELHSWA